MQYVIGRVMQNSSSSIEVIAHRSFRFEKKRLLERKRCTGLHRKARSAPHARPVSIGLTTIYAAAARKSIKITRSFPTVGLRSVDILVASYRPDSGVMCLHLTERSPIFMIA